MKNVQSGSPGRRTPGTDVSDEALVLYYEVRERAEQRSAGPVRTPATSDALRDEVESHSEQLYRQRLGTLQDLAVGEVGVGSGDFARYAVTQQVRRLVLIDLSPGRLRALDEELCRGTHAVATSFLVANAQSMDGVADGELDLLVAKEVIEHLTDYRPFLTECHRVLRPGGRLYLTTPNRAGIDMWVRSLLATLAPPAKRRGPALIRELFGDLFDHVTAQEVDELSHHLPAGFKEHIHEFAPGELVRCLRDHGFQMERRWGTPPQMFYHELRPIARRLLPAWNENDHLSYTLGDNLRILAVRSHSG